MLFQIGKVAKLLGMSSEGLRLYERAGIFKPQRGEDEQSYRTYEHLDFTTLIWARGYHYTGFSTKEIAAMIHAKEISFVTDLYDRRIGELEEELHWKTLLLENLREVNALCAGAEERLDQISFVTQPAMYRFPFIRDKQYVLTREQEKAFQQWLSKAPFVFVSQGNDWEQLLGGTPQVTSALGVLEEQAKALELDLQWAEYCPACPALHTVIRESGEGFTPLQCLKPLMDHVASHNYSVTGDPISKGFLSLNKNENYTRFREVWLPVEKKEICP